MRIAAAVGSGLSVVCATCENYWNARDRGVPDDMCLASDGCGSPIAGDVFHEYRGPMTQFDKFCFVCGNKSSHAVRVGRKTRVVGLCSDHLDMVRKLKPEGKGAANVVVISKDGQSHISEDSGPEKPMIRFRGSDG